MKRWPLLLMLGCGPGPATAVRVGVDFEPGLVVQQLSFSGLAQGATVFGPELRPEGMGTQALESGGELLVLLPDHLAGRELTCSVSAFDEGQMVAWSQSYTLIREGEEADCRVRLRRAATTTTPGPAMTTAPPLPPTCGGCFDDKGKCQPGAKDDQCGSGGVSCVKCSGDDNRCRSGRCVD